MNKILTIESKENKLIKYIKALQKTSFAEKENAFTLEGERIIKEALCCELAIRASLFTSEFYEKNKEEDYFKKLLSRSEQSFFIKDNLLDKIRAVNTNPGILILVNKKLLSGGCGKISGNAAVYLDAVKDPGNLGAILRTALAFGVKEIMMTPDTVSVYNTKAIRSSAGAVFKLRLYGNAGPQDLEKLKHKGYSVYATSSHAQKSVTGHKIILPAVLVFGEEAGGISDEARGLSDIVLKLPLKENVESLNVSITAAIFLYEALRGSL